MKPVRSPGLNGGERPIGLLVADDHPVIRKGLRSCLEGCAEFEVLAEARDGRETLRLARELAPDVILMDIAMPHMSGLAVTEALRKENPTIKILILSTHNTTDWVMRILRSGASGYVLKDAAPDEIVRAIGAVHKGEVFFSPQVAHLALNHFVRKDSQAPDPEVLSNREREVLTHLAEGLSNKEIACRLNIGTRTVETHRERLMRKLSINNIAGLTKFAIRSGLVPFPELALA